MNGIINVHKEKGFTSHDVVAKLRGILHQKKIGHTGTLDPDATGVLPVCVGNATKLCGLLTDKSKEYEAVLLLGKVTDTQDISGTVLEEHDTKDVSEEKIRKILLSHIGKGEQIPPMYSALKVNGKKLYELAREGVEVERKPRPIEIFGIEILEADLPRVRFRVSCSKGTYIRTLCHDVGQEAGCGAVMESLIRTRVDRFAIDEALTLSKIEELQKDGKIDEALLKVEDYFSFLPKAIVSSGYQKAVENGNQLKSAMFCEKENAASAQLRVYDEAGRFYGLYQETEPGLFKPVQMFL